MQSVIAHIKEGSITNKTAVENLFKSLKDGSYDIAPKLINKRSSPQNRYYWKVIEMVRDRMNELGNEVDSLTVHAFFKDRFNSKEITKNDIVIGTVGSSTTELTKGEFEEYLEKIKRFCAEVLDLNIPDPNEPIPLFYEENNLLTTTR